MPGAVFYNKNNKKLGDSYGQLGISSKGIGKTYAKPKVCSFNIVIQDLSCGEEHAALLTNDGLLYTMGNNLNGRLGLKDKNVSNSTIPCLVETLLDYNIVKVACGWTHTAAVSSDGCVFTWGSNEFGALGHGNTENVPLPKKVEFFNNSERKVKMVSCGSRHTAFVTTNGELYLCGSGDAGQLGTGMRTTELIPKKVSLPSNEKISMVSCGIFHTFIITENGALWGTGGNSFGQLGLGHKKGITNFTQISIPNNPKIKSISCGHHTGILTENGNIFVCGSSVFGEKLASQRIGDEKIKFKELTIGSAFGAAIDENGRTWVWGANTSGELGTGDYEPRSEPFMIDALKEKTSVKICCGGSYAICLGTTHLSPPKPLEPLEKPMLSSSRLEIQTDCLISTKNAKETPVNLDSNLSRNIPESSKNAQKSKDSVSVAESNMPTHSVSDICTAEIFSSVSQREPHQPLIAVLTKQRDYLEETLDKERKERKRIDEELLKLKSEFMKLKSYAEESEAEKIKEKEELDNMINLCTELKNKLTEYEQKISDLEKENEIIKNTNTEKNKKLEEFSKTKDMLKKKYSTLKHKIKEHIETEAKLEKENNNLIQKLKEIGQENISEIQEMRMKNENLEKQISALNSQLKDLSEKSEKQDENIKNYETQIAELSAKIGEQQEKINQNNKEKENLQNELAEQRNLAQNYENNLKTINGEFENLKSEITQNNDQASDELKISKEKLNKMNEENKNLSTKVQEINATNEKLCEKVKELENILLDKSSELGHFRKLNEELAQRNSKLMEALHQNIAGTGSASKQHSRIVSPGNSDTTSENEKEKEQFSFRDVKIMNSRGIISPPQNLMVNSVDDPAEIENIKIMSPGQNMQNNAKKGVLQKSMQNGVSPNKMNSVKKCMNSGKKEVGGLGGKLMEFEQKLKNTLAKTHID